MTSVAADSIRFDLTKIGQSIYEAHTRSGHWPSQVSDIEGTAYLRMPYRKAALEDGLFKVVWHTDLDTNPSLNRNRVLAYSNGGLLARVGLVWACYGDLRVERIGRRELALSAIETIH
jgi:hypothetical protein